MSTPRSQLIELIERRLIPKEKIDIAFSVVRITPEGKSWRSFIDHLLLWLGGLALAFAVLFFIAYNWNDLGRFAKFGMIEVFIALAIIGYCKLDFNSVSSKVSLLVATISLGVLLAFYGQTYQTGADSWQLFFNWALLMLPWAIIGRFSAIWMLWIGLVNVSIILYYTIFRGMFGIVFSSESALLWVLFLFNTAAFISWQLLATSWKWLSERWAIRLLGFSSGVPITWLVLDSIFDNSAVGALPGLVWALWLIVMYYVYRKIKIDLFMLAGCCLSTISITVSFLGEHMLSRSNAGAFLFLAVIVIGMGGGAALWLKKVHQECLS